MRYKQDCEEFYGRILDNKNVVSSLEATSRTASEEIWKTLFPAEPYGLDMSTLQDDTSGEIATAEKCTKYDLISAVQRQSPFSYQVSKLQYGFIFGYETTYLFIPSLWSCKMLFLLASRYQPFSHVL